MDQKEKNGFLLDIFQQWSKRIPFYNNSMDQGTGLLTGNNEPLTWHQLRFIVGNVQTKDWPEMINFNLAKSSQAAFVLSDIIQLSRDEKYASVQGILTKEQARNILNDPQKSYQAFSKQTKSSVSSSSGKGKAPSTQETLMQFDHQEPNETHLTRSHPEPQPSKSYPLENSRQSPGPSKPKRKKPLINLFSSDEDETSDEECHDANAPNDSLDQTGPTRDVASPKPSSSKCSCSEVIAPVLCPHCQSVQKKKQVEAMRKAAWDKEMSEMIPELESYYDQIVQMEDTNDLPNLQPPTTECLTSPKLELEIDDYNTWAMKHLAAFKQGDSQQLNQCWSRMKTKNEEAPQVSHTSRKKQPSTGNPNVKKPTHDSTGTNSNGAYDPNGKAMESTWARKWLQSKQNGLKTVDHSILSTYHWLKFQAKSQVDIQLVEDQLRDWFGQNAPLEVIAEAGRITLYQENGVLLELAIDEINKRATWLDHFTITQGWPERKYVVKLGPIDIKLFQKYYGPSNSALTILHFIEDIKRTNVWLNRGDIDPYKVIPIPGNKTLVIYIRVSKNIFDEGVTEPGKKVNIYARLGHEVQIQWLNTYSVDWCLSCMTKNHRLNEKAMREQCERPPVCSKCTRIGHKSYECAAEQSTHRCNFCLMLLPNKVRHNTDLNHRPLSAQCTARQIESNGIQLTHFLHKEVFHSDPKAHFFDIHQF
jgi:hypothetical protein